MNCHFTLLPIALIVVLLASVGLADDPTNQPPAIHVPDGFVVEKIAGTPLVK